MLAVCLGSAGGVLAQTAARPPVASPEAAGRHAASAAPADLAALFARAKSAVATERDAAEKLLSNVAAAPAAAWEHMLLLRRVAEQRERDVTAALKTVAVEDPVAAAVAASAVLHMRALRGALDSAHAGDNAQAVALRGWRDPSDDWADAPDGSAGPPRGPVARSVEKSRPSPPRAPVPTAAVPDTGGSSSPWFLLLVPVSLGAGYGILCLYRHYRKDRRFANRRRYVTAVRMITEAGEELSGQMHDISWGGIGVRLDDGSPRLRSNTHLGLDFGTGAVFACVVIRNRRALLALRFDVLNEDNATDLDAIMALPPDTILGRPAIAA